MKQILYDAFLNVSMEKEKKESNVAAA